MRSTCCGFAVICLHFNNSFSTLILSPADNWEDTMSTSYAHCLTSSWSRWLEVIKKHDSCILCASQNDTRWGRCCKPHKLECNKQSISFNRLTKNWQELRFGQVKLDIWWRRVDSQRSCGVKLVWSINPSSSFMVCYSLPTIMNPSSYQCFQTTNTRTTFHHNSGLSNWIKLLYCMWLPYMWS